MISKILSLFKNKYIIQTVFYASATAVSNIANFIIAIIFIYGLTPEEYSKVVLLKASLIMITSFMSLGISQGVVRWISKNTEKKILISSVIYTIFFQSIFSTLIYIFVLISLHGVINANITISFIAVIFSLNFSMMLNNELLNWYRANQDSIKFSIYTFIRSFTQIFSIFILLSIFSSFMTYIYGLFLAELILLALLLFSLRKTIVLSFSKLLIQSILKYSWPHALIISSGFILNFIDRFMLSRLYGDVSVIAYYDAASMLLLAILSLASRPFNLFIFPAYTSKNSTDGLIETVSFIEKSQKYFVIILIILLAFVSFFSSFLLDLFFPKNYTTAAMIIPILSYGLLLNSLYVSAMAGLYISDRTVLIAFASITGVTFNIIINYLLIPEFGMIGAAIGTSCGFAAAFFTGYFLATKFLYIRLPVLLIFAGFVIISISSMGIFLGS